MLNNEAKQQKKNSEQFVPIKNYEQCCELRKACTYGLVLTVEDFGGQFRLRREQKNWETAIFTLPSYA